MYRFSALARNPHSFRSRHLIGRCALVASLCWLSAVASAQSVNDGFDPAPDGLVVASVVQADGKLVVSGGFGSIAGQSRSGIARLDVDGRTDTGFANVLIQGGSVNRIVVQADGKLVIAGDFTQVGGQPRQGIARLLANGNLDAGFVASVTGVTWALANDPSGGVLVGGEFSQVNGVAHANLARLNNNGSLDASFNPQPDATVRALLRQSDGGLLVGGDFQIMANQAHNRIARFLPGGAIDPGFGLSLNNSITALAEQPDRRLLLAGSFTQVGGQSRVGLARLLTNGSVDPGFSASVNGFVSSMLAQRDGRIVIGGQFTTVNGQSAPRLARLLPNGTLDFTLYQRPTVSGSVVATLAQQLDGKLVVGGGFSQLGSVTRSNLGRFEEIGSLETTVPNRNFSGAVLTAVEPRQVGAFFGGNFTSVAGNTRQRVVKLLSTHGLDPIFDPELNATVFAIAVLEDDSLIVAGDFTTADGQTRTRLLRFTSIDTLDSSYTPSANDTVRSIWAESDGSVFITGDFTSVNGGTRTGVARLNADGSLSSFDVIVDGPVFSLVEDGRNLIFAGNFTTVNGQPRSRIARVNRAGQLDMNYNPGANGNIVVLATQPDDRRVLVGGSFTEIDGQARSRVARLNTDGSLDASFAAQASGDVYSIVPMSDGSTMLGGLFGAINGVARGRVARVSASGALDPDFDPVFNGQLFGLTPGADGKLWAVGTFTTAQGTARNGMARISQNRSAQASLTLQGDDVVWSRGGAAPELAQEPLLYTSSDGNNYTFAGFLRRIGSNWKLTNLDNLATGQTLYLRARGVVAGGFGNGSRSRVETTAQVLVPAVDDIFANGFE